MIMPAWSRVESFHFSLECLHPMSMRYPTIEEGLNQSSHVSEEGIAHLLCSLLAFFTLFFTTFSMVHQNHVYFHTLLLPSRIETRD